MNRPKVTVKPPAGTKASGLGIWPPLFLLLTGARQCRRNRAAPAEVEK